MLTDYSDITEILGEPIWWDRHGVPRYKPFEPSMAGVYIDQAVLYVISCQNCGRHFVIGDAHNMVDLYEPSPRLQPAWLHYGDPPAHGCVGDTMNCWDHRILEWWERDFGHVESWDWQRIPELDGYALEEGCPNG